MPHITLPDGLPGITGPLAFRPETAKPMRALAEFLLRGPNTLSSADREIIATYTSRPERWSFLPDKSWRRRRTSLRRHVGTRQ